MTQYLNDIAAIMAYRRTTNFFYAFYIMKTLTDMVSEGTTVSLALAYVVFTFTFNYMYPKILSPIPSFIHLRNYLSLYILLCFILRQTKLQRNKGFQRLESYLGSKLQVMYVEPFQLDSFQLLQCFRFSKPSFCLHNKVCSLLATNLNCIFFVSFCRWQLSCLCLQQCT